MTARTRLLALLTTVALAGGVLAANPSQAATEEFSFTTSSGTFVVFTGDGSTYTISDWQVEGACPRILEIPDSVLIDDLADPETGDYPVIDSFFSPVFRQRPCLSSGVASTNTTGSTKYVSIPESIVAIPAGGFQNDNLVKGFDFVSTSAQRPSVGTGAFTCTLAECAVEGGTPWRPIAFYDSANSANWDEGGVWNGMTIRVLPTFEITDGPFKVLDRRHAKLGTAVTANVNGTLTVSASAMVKIGRSWRKRTVCSKSVAIAAGATVPVICTAGSTARQSIRLRNVKFRLSYTFTQDSSGRQVSTGSSVTVKRTR